MWPWTNYLVYLYLEYPFFGNEETNACLADYLLREMAKQMNLCSMYVPKVETLVKFSWPSLPYISSRSGSASYSSPQQSCPLLFLMGSFHKMFTFPLWLLQDYFLSP